MIARPTERVKNWKPWLRGRRMAKHSLPRRMGRPGRVARSEVFLSGAEPRQGSCFAARFCASNGRYRAGAGRGPGIRSARLPEAAGTADRGPRGCGVWLEISGRAAAGALLLALRCEPDADAAFGYLYEPEADGYGDVLQGFPERGSRRGPDQVEPIWIRTGDYSEDRKAQVAHLRSADYLCWAHLRRRQENYLEGRLPGVVVHHS